MFTADEISNKLQILISRSCDCVYSVYKKKHKLGYIWLVVKTKRYV